MPGAVAHVVYNEIVYEKHFSHLNKLEFFIGTLFPDIRYLGVIDRDKTHLTEIAFDDIDRSDAFRAGFQFHSYLDLERERFVHKHGLYKLCPKNEFTIPATKFLEDRLIYSKGNNFSEVIGYLDRVLPQEIGYGIDKSAVATWHQILQKYISVQPTHETQVHVMSTSPIMRLHAEEVVSMVDAMEKDSRITSVLQHIYL